MGNAFFDAEKLHELFNHGCVEVTAEEDVFFLDKKKLYKSLVPLECVMDLTHGYLKGHATVQRVNFEDAPKEITRSLFRTKQLGEMQ